MAKRSYTIISDSVIIQKEFAEYTPFNLINDIKEQNLKEKDLELISVNLADEIKLGFGRKSCAAVYWGYMRKANWAKIKVVDVNRSTGKSHGFRCIVLVDDINFIGYLLHIYRHGHGENENISNRQHRMLNRLVDEYIDSIEREEHGK